MAFCTSPKRSNPVTLTMTMLLCTNERTRKAGTLIGTVGPTPEMVKDFIGWGYHFVAVASDSVCDRVARV